MFFLEIYNTLFIYRIIDIIIIQAYNDIKTYPQGVNRRDTVKIAIDGATQEALKDMLKEKNKSAVRIVIKGFG
jgi:hypothetical protein